MRELMGHLQVLIELWSRRHSPATADLTRAVGIAEALDRERTTPLAIKALTYRIVTELHASAGWEMGDALPLASCRSAATSVAQTSHLLLAEVGAHLEGAAGPVLILGVLGAGRRIFGRWDALPTAGCLLVPLFDFDGELPSGSEFPVHRGVRWSTSTRHHDLLARGAEDAELDGRAVKVPDPVVTAARACVRAGDPFAVEGIVFAAAAHAACSEGRWGEVVSIASRLGHGRSPVDTAVTLGLDRWLGLEVGPLTRLGVGLRRVLGNGAEAEERTSAP